MNWMFFLEIPLTLRAIVTIRLVVRPASVVSACAFEIASMIPQVLLTGCAGRRS